MEIVDYETTDVLAVNEQLPFKQNSFDAVISSAVLEHVRHPFQCASEIIRVLKPGGKLLCCVPFLQPLHGYPHHYFNMTHQGLRSLFEDALVIDAQKVTPPIFPIWTMSWMVHSWSGGLNEAAREQFLSTPLREFLTDPWALMARPWVTGLSEEKNFELASATLLFAHKPPS
jgi:SAM-dependent methyltransferase